jgi:YHS domain-containing protein
MVHAPPQSQWLRRRHRNPTRPTTNTLAIMVHPWPLVPSRRLLAVAVSVVVLVSAVARAETPPVAAVNAADGFALKGYDAVAYFTTGEPTPGVDEYTHRWKGVTYRFASAENRDRFRADPERYVPQYGGYCAYAMSIDRIADIDPSRWAIVDGKLYLNNNRLSQALWSVDKRGRIASGDRNWAVFPKKSEGQ